MMRIYSTIALIVISLCLTSCLDKKPRSFFAEDGIIVGDAKKVGKEDVFIPISFKTQIVHSAQIFHDVEWAEKNGVIYITAIYNEPPFSKKIDYSGGIVLKKPKLQTYDLKYKDPNPGGGIHDISKIKMP
ncbi:MAG: hypothetical protein P8I97_08270 [Verrucomicrobiales bacterium]|nr:hypothetical protein [Verrucomicrobiales bacterium]